MAHPAMSPNHVAVITGGASGIGLAAAMRFAQAGMKVAIADLGADRLKAAETKLSSAAPGGAANIMTAAVDVSRIEDIAGLESAVQRRFGGTDILMNNAGIQPGSKMFGPPENWQRILAVNLWGVINGSQVFAPHMIERGRAGEKIAYVRVHDGELRNRDRTKYGTITALDVIGVPGADHTAPGDIARIKGLLYDDSELSHDELRLLLARSAKDNGWEEPGMQAYDR